MAYYPIMLEGTVLIFIAAVLALIWTDRFPSLETIIKAMEALNTKGGNLLILVVFTGAFAIISIRSFLYIIDLSVNGKLQQDNTFALQFVAWVTGGLTIGFMGALLKTMTGDAPSGHEKRSTDEKEIESNSKQTKI